MEMMDKPAIHAAEAFVHAGYPLDVESLLIVELDGPAAEVDDLIGAVEQIAREQGAVYCRVSDSEEERARFWAGRKAAFPAVGRISPDYVCMDGTIPRKELANVLDRIRAIGEKHGLRVANVFHAGDGNLHPLVLYDASVEGQAHLAEELAAEILAACVDAGGSLSGEHGIGLDKARHMPAMFGEADLDAMHRLRCGFDPAGRCNPGKVFPTPRLCGEVPGPYREHPLEREGVAERW
jgi:glycolate oxidase